MSKKKKMEFKPAWARRSVSVSVALRPGENVKLHDLAEAAGTTKSQFLRGLLLDVMGRGGQ